ncbi:hypothetical protein WALSEDRAFT_60481 [Wallemia mellicola CBS 633.66]|uniref:N-alpha-acetyltransferase 40 n=1 Tax=Wallemia mellicola (strain ATCC MYA-4683 / CBS 633.66) TaxID=671144 RepID=I4YC40_WALMC|nr:hypothetical protein WALSEDRAFT_60481 [Wallemia mellicola CBS 633.66]EIM21532.1 hypothetical protein WALSEDRAFT_60481 [Wallemia mellicola CBS 633.66]|eukprot:XP_006958557.1 hypothetical protein WALSEDRAFT_60481 [Wallemia mellicola CBS 633.66]
MHNAAQLRAKNARKTSLTQVNEIFQSRLEYEVLTQIGNKIPESKRNNIFTLYENNMRSVFESIGEYDRNEKYEEIFNEESVIVSITKDEELVAFVSFRFDTEEGEEENLFAIIYLYELQVQQSYQNGKIGAKCLDSLHSLKELLKLDKTMLTVSKYNPRGVKFYSRNHFELDEIDPSWFEGGENENYHIMSRA